MTPTPRYHVQCVRQRPPSTRGPLWSSRVDRWRLCRCRFHWSRWFGRSSPLPNHAGYAQYLRRRPFHDSPDRGRYRSWSHRIPQLSDLPVYGFRPCRRGRRRGPLQSCRQLDHHDRVGRDPAGRFLRDCLNCVCGHGKCRPVGDLFDPCLRSVLCGALRLIARPFHAGHVRGPRSAGLVRFLSRDRADVRRSVGTDRPGRHLGLRAQNHASSLRR